VEALVNLTLALGTVRRPAAPFGKEPPRKRRRRCSPEKERGLLSCAVSRVFSLFSLFHREWEDKKNEQSLKMTELISDHEASMFGFWFTIGFFLVTLPGAILSTYQGMSWIWAYCRYYSTAGVAACLSYRGRLLIFCYLIQMVRWKRRVPTLRAGPGEK
jgi:hypothetical protein